ncbi:MAG: serine protease [Desulfobacterales bacterium]|nr:serine protease [Desulfobacterales bacterium]
MNILALSILLQLAGVAVVIAEIIIPSGGILSIFALGLFGYSLFMVFNKVSVTMGAVFLTLDLILIPVLIIVGLKLLARSPVTLRTRLSRSKGVTSQSPDLADLLNRPGKALSHLRPGGVALIDGQRRDVVSRGEFIARDSAIKVIAVTGNQIIVRSMQP